VFLDAGNPLELPGFLERDAEEVLERAVILVHRRDGASAGLDEARQVRLDVVLGERGRLFPGCGDELADACEIRLLRLGAVALEGEVLPVRGK